jgi:uncharacterized protein (DUF427 family)
MGTMAQALEDQVLPAGADRPNNADVRVELSPRRVRAFFAGEPIADSKRVLLVFEPRRLPVYYFPVQDVRMDLLRPTAHSEAAPEGPIARWSIESHGRSVDNVAWSYRQPDEARAALENHIAFYWGKLDSWFEEDDEVFVHPRDPYHRVDVRRSARPVRIEVGGDVIAETTRARLLFETQLPVRFYVPREDVRVELHPGARRTYCPYKGQASYWSLHAGGRRREDLGWSYEAPLPDAVAIAGLVAFWDERVDVFLDGERRNRPAGAIAAALRDEFDV